MTRRTLALVAAASMAFAVYVSILPFTFEPMTPRDAYARFAAIVGADGPERMSRSNFIANVLLFVPVGFALTGAFALGRSRRAGIVAAAAVAPLSLATSVTAEFLQVFVPGRVVSRSDIVAQSIGCAVGFAAWLVSGPVVARALDFASRRQRRDRIARAMAAYTFGWVFVNLAPFDATFDAGALVRRYRDGLINPVPFVHTGTAAAFVWDGFITALAAVPVGILAVAGWTGVRARRHSSAALVLGAGLIGAIELTQVFIRHHAADANDVMFGTVGVIAGVLAARRLLADRTPEPLMPAQAVSARAVVLLLVWCGVICVYHWRPFDFSVDIDRLRDLVRGTSLVPFEGYWRGRDLQVLNTALAKIGVALPFGAFAAFVVRPGAIAERVVRAAWIAAAFCLFAVIEAGQLLLPSRTPEPTDVIVSTAAAVAGLWIGRWAQAGVGPDRKHLETHG